MQLLPIIDRTEIFRTGKAEATRWSHVEACVCNSTKAMYLSGGVLCTVQHATFVRTVCMMKHLECFLVSWRCELCGIFCESGTMHMEQVLCNTYVKVS